MEKQPSLHREKEQQSSPKAGGFRSPRMQIKIGEIKTNEAKKGTEITMRNLPGTARKLTSRVCLKEAQKNRESFNVSIGKYLSKKKKSSKFGKNEFEDFSRRLERLNQGAGQTFKKQMTDDLFRTETEDSQEEAIPIQGETRPFSRDAARLDFLDRSLSSLTHKSLLSRGSREIKLRSSFQKKRQKDSTSLKYKPGGLFSVRDDRSTQNQTARSGESGRGDISDRSLPYPNGLRPELSVKSTQNKCFLKKSVQGEKEGMKENKLRKPENLLLVENERKKEERNVEVKIKKIAKSKNRAIFQESKQELSPNQTKSSRIIITRGPKPSFPGVLHLSARKSPAKRTPKINQKFVRKKEAEIEAQRKSVETSKNGDPGLLRLFEENRQMNERSMERVVNFEMKTMEVWKDIFKDCEQRGRARRVSSRKIKRERKKSEEVAQRRILEDNLKGLDQDIRMLKLLLRKKVYRDKEVGESTGEKKRSSSLLQRCEKTSKIEGLNSGKKNSRFRKSLRRSVNRESVYNQQKKEQKKLFLSKLNQILSNELQLAKKLIKHLEKENRQQNEKIVDLQREQKQGKREIQELQAELTELRCRTRNEDLSTQYISFRSRPSEGIHHFETEKRQHPGTKKGPDSLKTPSRFTPKKTYSQRDRQVLKRLKTPTNRIPPPKAKKPTKGRLSDSESLMSQIQLLSSESVAHPPREQSTLRSADIEDHLVAEQLQKKQANPLRIPGILSKNARKSLPVQPLVSSKTSVGYDSRKGEQAKIKKNSLHVILESMRADSDSEEEAENCSDLNMIYKINSPTFSSGRNPHSSLGSSGHGKLYRFRN